MRILVWALRLLVFLLLMTLALHNLHPAEVTLMQGFTWEIPTVLLILVSFLVGLLSAGLGLLGPILRQRREVLRLSAELHAATPAQSTSSESSLLPPRA